MNLNQIEYSSSLSKLELLVLVHKKINASELGAEANTFLMVYNASETVEGSYDVMVGE